MSVHSLSTEMITKLFVHCIEDFPNTEDSVRRIGGSAFEAYRRLYDVLPSAGHSMPYSMMGMRLSHVSAQWREIAIATPRLWCMIRYTLGHDEGKASTWIDRSSQGDIDIDIQNDRSPTVLLTDQLSSLNKVMAMLLPQIGRWRTFTLCISNENVMQNALHHHLYPAQGALRLRSLSINYVISPHQVEFVFDPAALEGLSSLFGGHTPLLTHVCLRGVHIQWSNTALLSGLKCLRLANHEPDGHMSWQAFARILNNCSELHTLRLANSGPMSNGNIWPLDIVLLPYLTRLFLEGLDPQYCGALMNRLDLPSLRELTLGLDAGYPERFIQDQLIGGRNNIFGRLETLTILDMDYSDNITNLLYDNLPNLTRLDLDLSRLEPCFLQNLVDPNLTPQLATLVVTGCGRYLLALQVVVAGRRVHDSRLKRLLLSRDDEVSPGLLNWFREQVETVDWIEVE